MMIQSTELIPAYSPSRREILSMELEARHWSQCQFAAIIGKLAQVVNEILHAKKQITQETTLWIAAASGTLPELWSNLEADYRPLLAHQTILLKLLHEISE